MAAGLSHGRKVAAGQHLHRCRAADFLQAFHAHGEIDADIRLFSRADD